MSPYYDPMIAKLVVWSEDRGSALKKLKNSLHRYQVGGEGGILLPPLYYVSRLVILSLKMKRTDWSTFAMYWGTLVMYPGF